jgi:glycosyltransferase involved in cell wall biosynthesis
MRPPSLRILAAVDAGGSGWNYGLDLAAGLSRLGVETGLATIGTPPSAEQKQAAARVRMLETVETGLALDRFDADRRALAAAGAALARIARAAGADLVQLEHAGLAADTRFEMPVVVAHHHCVATWWEAVHGGPLPAQLAWRAGLVRAGLEAADAVVAPSAAFAAQMRRLYRLAAPPHVVHRGRAPRPLRSVAPHDFVLTAGRLWDRGKNLATLDAAAAGLDVPVHAAGPLSGPDRAGVMFDHLHCLGTLGEEALARSLSARPVFVSAALYEPFGIAVLEAAAAGCALILSDIPSFRELWSEVAIFVPARDERAFGDAIGALVGDDFERAVLGRAARERAALYTPDAMAAQMAALYRSLLPQVLRPVLAAARAA